MVQHKEWYQKFWEWLTWKSAFGKWRRKIHCKLFGHTWYWTSDGKRFCPRCYRLIGDEEKGKAVGS